MTAITIKSEEHWHELRAKHIGASEVSALFGMNRYTSKWQLWMEKAGKLPLEDLSRNKFVQAGKHLESGIAAWAAEIWSMPLQKVTDYHTNDACPGMGATLDYTDGKAPVEIKWSGWAQGFECEGNEIVSAPDSYLIQIQHQIACYGGDHGYLIALINNEPRRMRVTRDDKLIDAIQDEVYQFWVDVELDRQPDPDFTMDTDAIERLIYDAPLTDITLDDPGFAALLEDYVKFGEAERANKLARDVVKGEMLLRIHAEMATRNASQDKARIQCGERKMSLTMVKESLGREVTADMVGSYVGGRKGYPMIRVS